LQNKKKTQYTTVHIPIELLKLVDVIINEEKFGYSSRAEFVKDAIRRYLEWFGYYPPKKEKMRVEEFIIEAARKLSKKD